MAAELWALTRAARADTAAYVLGADDKLRAKVKQQVEDQMPMIMKTLRNQAKYGADTESEGRSLLERRERERSRVPAAGAERPANYEYFPCGYTTMIFGYDGNDEYVDLFVAELKARDELDGVRIERIGNYRVTSFTLHFEWRPPSLVETERPRMW